MSPKDITEDHTIDLGTLLRQLEGLPPTLEFTLAAWTFTE